MDAMALGAPRICRGGLQPVHRHLDVHENEIVARALEGIGSSPFAASSASQPSRPRIFMTTSWFTGVLGDEHARARGASVEREPRGAVRERFGGHGQQGFDHECGATASSLAARIDPPIAFLETATDGQAEPHAAVASGIGRIRLLEWLKAAQGRWARCRRPAVGDRAGARSAGRGARR
ncbi:MAG: hypothetical protein U0Q12_02370 [Vicinamibacterales bacterium]